MSKYTTTTKSAALAHTNEDEEFPFIIGAPKWKITQELRDRYQIQLGTTLNFVLQFSDGSRLTDIKYRPMLIVIQTFLRFRWLNYGKSSFYNIWCRLSHFILFIVNVRKVMCLSRAWGVDEYVAYVKARTSISPRSKKAKNKNEEKPMKPTALFAYLAPVKELWRISHKMPDGLKLEPWVGKTPANVAGIRTSRLANLVLPYSLAEFAGFIRMAMGDLSKADEVCELLLSPIAWEKRLAAVAQLRTAASIIMFSLVGMRPDEVYALSHDCLKKGTLLTEEGKIDVTWLHGRIFKDKPPGGERHRWLAADEVVIAVVALQKLWRAIDKALQKPSEEGGIPEKTAPAIINSKGLLFPKLRIASKNRGVSSKTGLTAIKEYVNRPESREFLPGNVTVTQKSSGRP